MTTKHTPSPWRLSIDATTGAFAVEDDNRIAVLCQRAAWDHRADESAANARLIAAAPDMLAALRMFSDHYSHGVNPYLDEAYSLALDAIVKAESM